MANYINPVIDQEPNFKVVFYLDNKCAIFTCNGSPENVIIANTGSIACSDNGSVYKKTTDDIATGWIELTSGTVSSPLVVSGSNPTISLVDTDIGDDDGNISMQSDIMSLSVIGGTAVQIYSDGQIAGYPRVIEVNTTTVGNVGAGVDNLMGFSIPINSLVANNDFAEGIGIGNVAANDNDKTLILLVGGTTVLDTGPLDLDLTRGWRVHYTIIRISATSVLVSVQMIANALNVSSTDVVGTGGNGFHGGSVTTTFAVADLSTNALVIQFQGTGTNDDDIVQNGHIINLIRR